MKIYEHIFKYYCINIPGCESLHEISIIRVYRPKLLRICINLRGIKCFTCTKIKIFPKYYCFYLKNPVLKSYFCDDSCLNFKIIQFENVK